MLNISKKSIPLVLSLLLILMLLPSQVFAAVPTVSLSIPEPPTGQGKAWVAFASPDNEVVVFYLSVIPIAQLVGGDFPYLELEHIDLTDQEFTVSCHGITAGTFRRYVTVWRSSTGRFEPLADRGGAVTAAHDYAIGIRPSYIAFGGDIVFDRDVANYDPLSFVPQFGNGAEGSSWTVEDVDQILSDFQYLSDLIFDIHSLVANIDSNVSYDLDVLRSNLTTLLLQFQDVISTVSSGGVTLDYLRVCIDSTASYELFDILDEISSKLDTLDSFGDSIDRLNQAIAQMESSIESLSQEVATMTDVLLAEQQIWVEAQQDYSYGRYKDYGIGSFNQFTSTFNLITGTASSETNTDQFYRFDDDTIGNSYDLGYNYQSDFFTRLFSNGLFSYPGNNNQSLDSVDFYGNEGFNLIFDLFEQEELP